MHSHKATATIKAEGPRGPSESTAWKITSKKPSGALSVAWAREGERKAPTAATESNFTGLNCAKFKLPSKRPPAKRRAIRQKMYKILGN
jgi:hypothetical protein